MHVYIGSLQTQGAWDAPHLRACNKAIAQELAGTYTSSTLAGFYFAQEIWLNAVYWYGGTHPATTGLSNFVTDIGGVASGKQVLAAPYFKKDTVAGVPGMDSSQTGQALYNLLSATGLKLVAPQDGVGAQNGAPTLTDTASYYSDMSTAASNNNATLWSDLETFQYNSLVIPDKYPPADVSRISQQVAAEQPHVSKIISWMFGRDMSPRATYYPITANDLNLVYQNAYGEGIIYSKVAFSYDYCSQPSSSGPSQ